MFQIYQKKIYILENSFFFFFLKYPLFPQKVRLFISKFAHFIFQWNPPSIQAKLKVKNNLGRNILFFLKIELIYI